jgi:hypothetical protein
VLDNFRKLALGLLIGGFLTLIISGVSLAAVEQDRRVNALASVANLDNCKLESLGNLLGVEFRKSSFGATKDCNAPDPLDVQESVSTVALALAGISVAFGGILVFVINRRPELLSERKLKSILSKFGSEKESLDSKIRALDKLRKDGLLSDKEFEAQKKKILTDTGSGK